jgi:hypothetical protein
MLPSADLLFSRAPTVGRPYRWDMMQSSQIRGVAANVFDRESPPLLCDMGAFLESTQLLVCLTSNREPGGL